MARIRVDRLVALVLVLVLRTGTAWALNDARDDSYVEWQTLSYREKMTFCTAALCSATYALQKVESKMPELKGISGWLPYGMSNTEAVQLVEMVYADPRNRKVPYIAIILEPGFFYQMLGIRSSYGGV